MSIILDYFYQATSYIPLFFLAIIMLGYSPALAVFPRLTQTAFLLSIAPIISLGLLVFTGFILFHTGYYQHVTVLSISVIFFIVAGFRQYRFYCSSDTDRKIFLWQKNEQYYFLINIAILLPLVAISAFSAFMIDDALVSWHYWAIHYVNQVSPSSISGGYPLIFPYFLSYCYQFFGTTQYQGVIKALLCLLPLTLLNIFVFRPQKNTLPTIWIYLLVALISIFPGFLSMDFYRFYSVGYSDPLLATSITVSALLLLYYCAEEKKNNQLLCLTVIASITAGLAKQPGFLWALLGFPVLLMAKMIKTRRLNIDEILAILAVSIPVLGWITGAGKHFENNMGVISTSLGTTHITVLAMLKTLWHSVLTYWVYQPSLLLLYSAAVFSLDNLYKKIFFNLVILPGTVLWFIFGAYDIREGLYLLTCCGLLVMLRVNIDQTSHLKNLKNYLLMTGFVLFVFFSIREQNVQHNGVQGHRYPLNAAKTLIYHYFSTGAPVVYQQIFTHPSKKIWSPNMYVRGIFFGHNAFMIENSTQNSPLEVYQKIINKRPDYVFTNGKFHSKTSDAVLMIKNTCPNMLSEIPLGQPLYQVQLFQVNADKFRAVLCEKRLKKLD